MLTDRIFASELKAEIICDDSVDEIESNAILPVNFDNNNKAIKSTMTVMDLGKMLLQYCRQGETTKIHELLCRGAPFSTDWLGTSPIHLAAMNNHLSTCEVLLRAGISKDARTKVDRTPLHFAVFEGHEKMVELLLLNNCDVDARDMLKMTPLHWAVQKRNKQIVEILLNNNADPNVVSKFGKTPLIIAHETEQDDIVKILELVIRLRLNTKDQTQEATERLVFEMQQSSVNNDSVDDNIATTPIELDSEDSSTFHFNTSRQIQSNHISNLDDSNLIDSDDGTTSLSDAIIQLQNIEEPKSIDASTLQMLKDHGISMLPTDDTDNSLITSALQSGRKLVLSEAGKIILTDPKFKKLRMDTSPQNNNHNQQQNQLQSKTTTTSPFKLAQKKQPIIMPAKNFPIKSNKVIKILSAEQFKQMCGGNTLKKITYENHSPGIKMSTTVKSPNILQLTPQKFKRPVMQKNRLSMNSISKATNLRDFKNSTLIPVSLQHQIIDQSNIKKEFDTTHETTTTTTGTGTITPQTEKEIRNNIYSDMPALSTATTTIQNGLTKNNLINDIIINFNNSIHQNDLEQEQIGINAELENEQAPSLTWHDMERQILELKKANEEIWRQFEISQKINEDFRIRIVKLERELERSQNC